jgi:hypothetical protein
VERLRHLSLAKSGEKWPLKVNEGYFQCEKVGSNYKLFFQDSKSNLYAVNGLAKAGNTTKEIDMIWKNNPEIPGLKIDISSFIDHGLEYCSKL